MMRRAMRLAASRRPHPNPAVGAVVLDPTGAVVGEGCHEGPGNPHAEVVALALAGDRARGGTIVVTLEPCAHHGRTPPCTDAIIEAGVTRIVVGAGDPDDQVAGRGFAALNAAGITVESGVLAQEVEETDPGYFHHRRTGLPLMRLKVALTLDGQAAAVDGTSQWITGAEAREDGHRLRAGADAVMIGAGTLLADDPKLTVRLDDHDGFQPTPVVIIGDRSVPPTSAVLAREPILYTTRPIDTPAEVVVVPMGHGGVDLLAVAKDLAGRGLLSVLVEGGPTLAGSLMDAGLVSVATFYFGAMLAAGQGQPPIGGPWRTLADSRSVAIEGTTSLGSDLRVDLRVTS
ncbi:MAG: bifunctional diaminohydroxyphosphoribosylaminopyrimidine deaminase/5-amino-6-(5-phosphoribosylamino)uracil reductase RibD [Acidimicrobiia bacterium]|nr:bifunctional diaminohydroxyphosphoribosylaminopyrimidine deaminase/5-amino-6-(5-phosphoribosylamino)uracil reductase RibD [Acidimicrobiia bacterium]